MTLVLGYNQPLETALEIPGALDIFGAPPRSHGIRISVAPEQLETEKPLYTRTGEALNFHARKIACYRCLPDQIDVHPYAASDPDWVMGLLIATAIPAALWMQGHFVLHAAAIVPKGTHRAIAIAGASGVGKSTVTRQLLNSGAQLVADDSVALDVTPSGITASGLPGGVFVRTGTGDDRRFEPVRPNQSLLFAPLGAILILDQWDAQSSMTKLSKLEAAGHILGCRHRPRIVAQLDLLAPVLAQAVAVANQIPVYLWCRQKGHATLPTSECDMIAAMLDELTT